MSRAFKGKGNLDKIKRTITADGMAGDRLFAVPPVEQLLAPNYQGLESKGDCLHLPICAPTRCRFAGYLAKIVPYLKSLRLTFPNQQELEEQFKADYYSRFIHTNRRWLFGLSLFLLLLGINDTLQFESFGHDKIVLSWSVCALCFQTVSADCLRHGYRVLRAVGGAFGLLVVALSFLAKKAYEHWMQMLSSFALSLIGCILIQIGIEFKFYDDAQGVGLLLILTSLFSLFVGMRFKVCPVILSCSLRTHHVLTQFSAGSTVLVLLYYCIVPLEYFGATPSVTLFLLLGTLPALVTCAQ